MAYSAVVSKIWIRPHPNAERLMLGNCRGFQVVVGKDCKDGELGVFFPSDGQLSDEFCKANDLYPRLDKDGKRIGGGFIDPKHRRVRAQNFRGEKSEGFWVPLSYFKYARVDEDLAEQGEGYGFTEYCGYEICNKYFNEATIQAIAKRKKKGARRETTMFKAHLETEQLRRCLDEIRDGALVTVTEKLHGTSERYGNVLYDLPLPWYKRAWNWLVEKMGLDDCCIPPKMAWVHVIGTRNVILDPFSPIGEKYREDVIQKIRGCLKKGETFYFEVVGWGGGTPIMIPQDTTKLQDKKIFERYGPTMVYSYGCDPTILPCDFYIYRITMTNQDGDVLEYPWLKVKERAIELGLKHVPELVPTFIYQKPTEQFAGVSDGINLPDLIEPFLEGCSTIDPKHIREGVCVRVDQEGELLVYKEKSMSFKLLEGIAKEDPTQVDVEEAA